MHCSEFDCFHVSRSSPAALALGFYGFTSLLLFSVSSLFSLSLVLCCSRLFQALTADSLCFISFFIFFGSCCSTVPHGESSQATFRKGWGWGGGSACRHESGGRGIIKIMASVKHTPPPCLSYTVHPFGLFSRSPPQLRVQLPWKPEECSPLWLVGGSLAQDLHSPTAQP